MEITVQQQTTIFWDSLLKILSGKFQLVYVKNPADSNLAGTGQLEIVETWYNGNDKTNPHTKETPVLEFVKITHEEFVEIAEKLGMTKKDEGTFFGLYPKGVSVTTVQ